MGKKNKNKKNKHKKNKSPFSNGVDNVNANNSEKKKEQNEDDTPKTKISKEMRHKKKELRRKMKRISKKYKKKTGKKKIQLEQYIEEFEDLFMNPEDLEKLPHDRFFTYTVPITVEQNKEYIPLLIEESDIILELLDARDIYHSKNNKIEEIINNNEKKLLIYVITKCDLVSEEYLNKSKKFLEEQSKNKNPIIVTSSLLREKISAFLDELKDQTDKIRDKNTNIDIDTNKDKDQESIKVGIIGAPNVGKNSLIQSLELIVNSNCDDKYIYFNEEKSFCVNTVPGIVYDDEENNNFLISKQFKNINDIPQPINLIKNIFNIVEKDKFHKIYELNKIPENLDELISLIKEKYDCKDDNAAICKILNDIITGKIRYEVNN